MAGSTFAGFDDWIAIFRAGRQTDAAGEAYDWSRADLDQIIANHNAADPAPMVIGHPRTDDPAWGWVTQLRRRGDELQARFGQVADEFLSWVRSGRVRNRSVAVDRTPDGWALRHVGWLGANPPAVKGMPAVAFAASQELHTYSDDWQTPSLLGRVVRQLREWIISEQDVAAADQVLPEHLVQEAEQIADINRQPPEADPADASIPAAYAAPNSRITPTDPPTGGAIVPQTPLQPGGTAAQFSQADLDAAVTTAVDAATAQFTRQLNERSAQLTAERRERRLAECRAYVAQAADTGRLTPAMAAGMAEFLVGLPDEPQAGTLKYAAAAADAEPITTTPAAWFRAWVDGLPRRFAHLTGRQAPDAAAHADRTDAASLAARATEYMAAQAANGITISTAAAVRHVRGDAANA